MSKCNTSSTLNIFPVSNDEVNRMMTSLSSKEDAEDYYEWGGEVKNLSREWVRAIMSQPYKGNKQKRRPFDYSRKKVIEYLLWRKREDITSKIEHHINSDGSDIARLTTSQGSLYWHGVDSEGSPILWYRADKQCFDSAVVKNEMECSSLVIQAGLDAMPGKTYRFNFIVCFDVFNPLKAMKKPTLAPAFIKLFMQICPDRLKGAYMVTGSIGHMFYKVADTLCSASIMDKVIETRSREESARMMIRDGIISNDEVPIFMGGKYVHDKEITLNFPTMIRSITVAMI